MFDFSKFEQLGQKTMNSIQQDLSTLRTGGASPTLLDSVVVEAYGAPMKITELAAITVSDPTLLVISPWDQTVLPAIEKAIQGANLNLNPVVDGKIVRISIPPLTQESRQELIKSLHNKAEDGKIMLRTLRGETKKDIEKQEGNAGISEDDIKADLETLENKIKKLISELETQVQNKKTQLEKV